MIKKETRQSMHNKRMQDMKVKKNAHIITSIFWIAASLFIYSRDAGFSDVYSWKPFVFFIVGPIVSAIVFGNILFSLQKIVEKTIVSMLAKTKPHLIAPLISTIFFLMLVGIFLIIFEFSKLVQLVLS
mgnify:CR=1 FL=1|jgi:hypothetical protein|tara:strand:- start:154 stop:537 length:384 start_codon:yes stop_codon:yes gene_type:complete